MLLHFPFDNIEGTTYLGDINGRLYNNPLQVDGIQGKALSFTGTNQQYAYMDQK